MGVRICLHAELEKLAREAGQANQAFEEQQVFQGERMTAALLDRLTHRCHIFEMNGPSYRFKESVKNANLTVA